MMLPLTLSLLIKSPSSFLQLYDCSKMSWLLPYNRNYFLCNYQTYPQTGVVWVIGLLIPPFCEGNKRDSHDKKSSTLGDKSPSIRDIIRIVGWVGWKEKLECRVGEIGLMSNTELE